MQERIRVEKEKCEKGKGIGKGEDRIKSTKKEKLDKRGKRNKGRK